MSEIDKIVALLADDALDKRIAAAIVLGEIRAKGPLVAAALADALDSGVALLQRHALAALAHVGARKAAPKILPLLGARDEDVRRAAVQAMVGLGDEALPLLTSRRAEAGPEERRSIDAVLAALGGTDALHALLEGLAGSDAEAARAAAIAVRQRVKDADARQRRTYLVETERFLDKLASKGSAASAGAVAAGVKILGYLHDDKAVPRLLAFTKAEGHPPAVRQEALIALRFVLDSGEAGAEAGKVVAALVDAAGDADRVLAQTALHTLAGMPIPDEALERLEALVAHPDLERARFVMEMLGRQATAASARVLVQVIASTKDKRRAELAAACLLERAQEEGKPAGSPGSLPVRPEAVAPLAKALLDAADADRAWLLRTVLRPSARKVAPAVRRQMLDLGLTRLSAGDRNWEPLLSVVRDADPAAAAEALRALAARLRKTHADKGLTVLRVLCANEGCDDDDRYALTSAELGHSALDTRPAARAADEALRLVGALLDRGVDVAARLRKDKSLSPEQLYYVGFHFSEAEHPLGEELLTLVAERGGRTKVGRMAKAKLERVKTVS